jgi:hypothetical protein
MIADVLTKPLARSKFNYFKTMLQLRTTALRGSDMMHNRKDEIEQRKIDGDRESKVRATQRDSLLVGRKRVKVGERKLL